MMSIRELHEWYEFYSEDPFITDRIEIQMATLCNIAGSFAGSKLKHKDYMIRKEKPKAVSKEDYAKSLINAFKQI